MAGLRREEATRRRSKAEVRGPTRHRATETTGTDQDLRTTTTTTTMVTRTRTAAHRRAGGTLPPGQEVTEAESTGPVVRRERSVSRAPNSFNSHEHVYFPNTAGFIHVTNC